MALKTFFLWIPPILFLIVLGLLAWQFSGKGLAIFSILAMTVVGFNWSLA